MSKGKTAGLDQSQIVQSLTPTGQGLPTSGDRLHAWFSRKGVATCANCHREKRDDGLDGACPGVMGRARFAANVKPENKLPTEPDGLIHYGTSGLIPNPICNKPGGKELVKRIYVKEGVTCPECSKIIRKSR